MIEFKAACGHSVRARDSDAGKMVQCSYCGQMVQVPHADGGGLEDLLGEPAETQPPAGPPVGSGLPRVRVPTRLIKTLLGLIYVVVAVVVVAFGLKLVLERVDLSKESSQPVVEETETEMELAAERVSPKQEARPAGREVGRYGSFEDPYAGCSTLSLGRAGLVLRSVPSGAQVYLSGGGKGGELEMDPTREGKLLRGQTPLTLSNLSPGQYRVGFTLPVNWPTLRKWPGYLQYRRRVEGAHYRKNDYFVADDADMAGIRDPGNGPLLLHRSYPLVLRNTQWSAAIALFVPAKPLAELQEHFERLAGGVRFQFNEADAREEMAFYNVASQETDGLIEALRHLGKVVWTDQYGRSQRFFQVQPDGQIWSVRLGQGFSALQGGDAGVAVTRPLSALADVGRLSWCPGHPGVAGLAGGPWRASVLPGGRVGLGFR